MGVKEVLPRGELLPREKARKEGISSLKDEELVALRLDFGTKKEDVLTLSKRFLKEKGGLRGIFSSSLGELLSFGVNKAKAFRFLAVSEITKRLMLSKDDLVRDDESAYVRTKPYFYQRKEERIRVIYLDRQKRVIKKDFFESEEESQAYLPISQITREGIRIEASFVLLLHNHPSASLSPSFSDLSGTISLYRSLANANRILLDSLIVTDKEHLSFRRSSLGPFSDEENNR